MNINSALKKEGIKVVGKLNTLEVNKIASIISSSIANTFPEHNINQSDYKCSQCDTEHEHNPEAFSDSKIVSGQVRLEFRDYCCKVMEDIL